jgi:hypothetical protein
MTFTIKHRGRSSLVSADYRCPVHGLFNVLVERDENGDPPAEQPCPAKIDEDHSRPLVRVARCTDAVCGEPSPWTISAPGVHTQFVVSVSQGKPEPPPHKLSMQTRSLAEGQKFSEWKAGRRKLWEERRRAQLKRAFGR